MFFHVKFSLYDDNNETFEDTKKVSPCDSWSVEGVDDRSIPGDGTVLNFKITVMTYLWAFYFVPLIYISVFVPVPYCLDDCGFVVEPEVTQVDSSSSILLSQDCFGYSRFFVFPYKS